jgi:hypothetical protein
MDMVCRSKSYCGEKKKYAQKNICQKKHIPKKTYVQKKLPENIRKIKINIQRKQTYEENKHTGKTNTEKTNLHSVDVKEPPSFFGA